MINEILIQIAYMLSSHHVKSGFRNVKHTKKWDQITFLYDLPTGGVIHGWINLTEYSPGIYRLRSDLDYVNRSREMENIFGRANGVPDFEFSFHKSEADRPFYADLKRVLSEWIDGRGKKTVIWDILTTGNFTNYCWSTKGNGIMEAKQRATTEHWMK